MNAIQLTIFTCLLAGGLLPAAEPEVRYFADGLTTEATLEKAGDKLQLSVWRYNAELEGELILEGELTDTGERARRRRSLRSVDGRRPVAQRTRPS